MREGRTTELEASLRKIISTLRSARTPYMVIRALALTAWGSPVATMDFDIMIAGDAIRDRLIHRLSNAGFEIDTRDQESHRIGRHGSVYQATDTKLGRSVAIKFLPEAFGHGPESVARFQREARVLASLNHPNIASIHGLEEASGGHFLVMELIAGETLAQENRTWRHSRGVSLILPAD